MNEGFNPRSSRSGLLAVECWCRLEVVYVPSGAVRAGTTVSCGAPGCVDPKGAA